MFSPQSHLQPIHRNDWRSRALWLGALLSLASCSDDATTSPSKDAAADTGNDTSTADGTTTDVQSGGPKLYLNEIAAAGSPEDWVELYNPGDAAVDLAGWKFADSLSDPAKRVGFAAGASVPAKGFLQVQVTAEVQGWKLGGDEEVGLWDPSGALADSVDWNEGDSPLGGSYGRTPDGGATWQTFATATPGTSNGQ